ncbi:MAG: OmpA family protein [Stagnimonas sp.]|nr:OmpA family protein [Stagnimonas sp.]
MTKISNFFSRATLIGAASAAVLLASCATPIKPDGADATRAELSALQNDPKLAVLAPVAIQEAEAAVRVAETPTEDSAAGQQAVYVAQSKVAIARAQAERRLAEDNVKTLGEQRGEIRLDARTREAEIAKAQAEAATAAAMQQQQAAQAAMAEAADLKRQMLDLEAKNTDRGMVMTLGDVLFSTGKSDLKPGAAERLNKLASFMLKYPDRAVVIEGHTDSTGSASLNMTLSQQRADAVKAYLVSQSVPAASVTTVGKGKDVPVADNATASGRQQNRRVEIIIANVPMKK